MFLVPSPSLRRVLRSSPDVPVERKNRACLVIMETIEGRKDVSARERAGEDIDSPGIGRPDQPSLREPPVSANIYNPLDPLPNHQNSLLDQYQTIFTSPSSRTSSNLLTPLYLLLSHLIYPTSSLEQIPHSTKPHYASGVRYPAHLPSWLLSPHLPSAALTAPPPPPASSKSCLRPARSWTPSP